MIDKPWFKHYTQGVSKTIDTDVYHSLPDFFDDIHDRYKDSPAFTNFGETITFGELRVFANRFAAYLVNEAGLKRGDRIGLQMPNILQYPVCVIGALKAGLVIVNTNPLYTPREMERQFNDAGIKAIVIILAFV